MPANPVRVGLIGCGNISQIYLTNSRRFSTYDIVACADLDPERANAKAKEHGIAATDTESLLSGADIEAVLNLTTPDAHAQVALAAVSAGKSVYNEKPLTIRRDDAQQMLRIARDSALCVGCAPDTFLGAGLQTCRRLLDDGAIGRPLSATAFMMSPGVESWHPNPAFYYQPGGGPVFDMAPYYLTALIHLLGPIRRVTALTGAGFTTRTIASEPHRGQTINVRVPTHAAAVLDFLSGPIVSMIMSFDVQSHTLPNIEIYGAEGTMQVPDPNTFGGPVYIRKSADDSPVEHPITLPFADNSRGLGLADMCRAIRAGGPHRASGDLAYHVLDAMHAIHEASDRGRHIELDSTCDRPEPLTDPL